MYGQLLFAPLEGKFYGEQLGEIEGVQLHPTICKLLGVKPAEGVQAESLPLE